MEEFEKSELLKQLALTSQYYIEWRKIHKRAFGDIFENAFSNNDEAQIHLTAALINVSQRAFAKAIPVFDMLQSISDNEYDRAAMCYFNGLTYEFIGDTEKMEGFYEALYVSSERFELNYMFHPYFRTAKLAQKSCRCNDAIKYFQKAIYYYDGIELSTELQATVALLFYDLTTVCLFTHKYADAQTYLDFSHKYYSGNIPDRAYIEAVLNAVLNKEKEADECLKNVAPAAKQSGIQTVSNILHGADPHYCVISIDDKAIQDFWDTISSKESTLLKHVSSGKIDKAKSILSQVLLKAFPFMSRTLETEINENGDLITITCRNYYVKSLIEGHRALFSKKPDTLSKWNFISIAE